MTYNDEYAGLLSGFSKKGRETERTTLLEAFNGNLSIRVDRLSRDDDYVEKAAVSMLGSIQPGVLNKYIFKSQRSGDGDDGFIERHQCMVYPELSEEFEYIDIKIPIEKSARIRNVVDKLVGLPDIIKDSLVLKFSDESQKLFIEWYESLFKKVRKKREITTKHLSHLGKYNSFMPSLALIFHICDCIDRNIDILDSTISKESTKLAIRWCEILEEHAIKIYGESDCKELVSAHTFLEKILNGELRQGYPVRQIYRRGMANLSTHSDVKNALKILEQHNIAREEKIYGTRGAPSYILDINPEVYDVF